MRYRLRTLLIVLALGPPLMAGAWWGGRQALAAYSKQNRPRCGGGHLIYVPDEITIIEVDESPAP